MQNPTNIFEIADSAGAVVDGVHRLRLGTGLTLTKNTADPSAQIDATGVPADGAVTTAKIADGGVTNAKLSNSGTTAGRVGVQVLLDYQTLSAAASFTSAAFTAGGYSKIIMEIEGAETAGTFEPILQLTGLTSAGAGKSRLTYTSSTTNTVFDDASTMHLAVINAGNLQGNVEIFPKITGRQRHYFSKWSGDGAVGRSDGHGFCTDTTHDITAVGWTGSTSFTGTVRVWGIPA